MPKPKPSPEALAAKRAEALAAVEESLERLRSWHGMSEEEISPYQRAFDEALADHKRNIRRALRLGLANHPLVAPYVQSRRVLGGWEQLRDARAGAEKGVKRPYGLKRRDVDRANGDKRLNDQLTLERTIRDLLRRYEREHGRPCTQTNAYQLLIADKTITHMSRQGFHKLLKRLGILHLFPERRRG